MPVRRGRASAKGSLRMRLVSPDRVLYVVADKAKLKALVEQLGGRGLGLPGMAAVARW